jgi:hypothetical protein
MISFGSAVASPTQDKTEEVGIMSRWKSYEEIKNDYICGAENITPGKGREIGETYLFLAGKLLFMKHRFSEYRKMMGGKDTDRILLRHYFRHFFRDASNAFLDAVILEIVNFLDNNIDAQRGHLSLKSFGLYLTDNVLRDKINEIETRANPIIRQRHAFVAHWGRVANLNGQTIPISIDDLDCIIELITEVMDYVGEKLLGVDHYTERTENYHPWELIGPGGVEHIVAYLRQYEWLSHKRKQYARSNEPFLKPRWLDLSSKIPKGEQERREQEERILTLVGS